MDVGILTLVSTVVLGLLALAVGWPSARLARLQLADRKRAGLPMEVRLRPVLRVYVGTVLIIAGIAGFIEVRSHPYVAGTPGFTIGAGLDPLQRLHVAHAGEKVAPVPATGLSPTAHDLLLIGAWALIILGAVTVMLGFVRERRSATPGT